MTKTYDLYLKIRIYNSNREHPIFEWNRGGGNIGLGIEVAKQFVDNKISKDRENKYQAYIKLKRDRGEDVLFEWNQRQGNVRLALDAADEFIHQKLGFNRITTINGEYIHERKSDAKV